MIRIKKQLVLVFILTFICIGLGIVSFQNNVLNQELRKENKSIQNKIKNLEQRLMRLQIELTVSRLRQLAFLKEPLYKEVKKEEVKERLLEEIKKEYPDQSIENIRKVLVQFGYIADDYNLMQGLLSAYSEQIGAYYDVDEKALFNIQGVHLGPGLQNALLAHELTHALQDQNFDIDKFINSKSKNDDRDLAINALIEGDATFMTQLYYLNSVNLSIFWDLLSSLFIDQKEFNKAPLVLRENMMFPYMHGLNFVAFIYNKQGWRGVNQCFRKVPKSTEEILHPSKYLLGNDPPQKLDLPSLEDIFPQYSLLVENILGEFNIHLLFKIFFGRQVQKKFSEGWGGDVYQLWEEKETRSLVLIWLSAWDSAQDAQEFFSAYHQLILKKFPSVVSIASNENFGLWQDRNRWIFVARNQTKILTIETPEKVMIDEIRSLVKGFEDLT
jgi:hypothetical protein